MVLQDLLLPIFQSMPGATLVLLPDSPKFTIVEVNDAYLKATLTVREKIIGRGIFEVFPDNPADPISNGVANLRSSLNQVVNSREPHQMAVQKYDVPLPDQSGFALKFWLPKNTPVLNADGSVAVILHTVEDVTEKELLKHALDKNVQALQALFDDNPEPVFSLNDMGFFTSANNGFARLFGYRVEELLTMQYMQLCQESDFERLDGILKACLSGQVISFPVTAVTAKQELIELNVTGMPLVINGQVAGAYGIVKDITEQVRSQKRVQETEKQYINLLQSLPVAVCSMDAGGRMLAYNKAAVDLWGFEPGIGQPWSGQAQVLYPDGSPVSIWEGPLAQTIRTGVPVIGSEFIIIRPDGESRHVITYPSAVFDGEGKVTGGVNVMIDITEKKRSDEELRKLSLIAQKTDNAVIITNPEGKIEWVNEAFTVMTGYTMTEAIGHKKTDLLQGSHPDKEIQQWLRGNGKGPQPLQKEIVNYTKSGKPFWIQLTHLPMYDARGTLTHFFDIGTDITERKHAFEKLQRSENEIRSFARQLNKVLEEERARIARELHDEMGQKLTGLKMSLSSLKYYLSAEGLGPLNTQVKEVDRLIKSLRKFATELRPGILNTLGLFPSIEWLVKDFEKRSGIRCSVKLKPSNESIDGNVSICCFRICQEALNNVVKHARATFVSVELEHVDRRLVLRVADNGKGMAKGKLGDPFSMGLLGMRERANLVGGRLFINSLPEVGTTVDLLVEPVPENFHSN